MRINSVPFSHPAPPKLEQTWVAQIPVDDVELGVAYTCLGWKQTHPKRKKGIVLLISRGGTPFACGTWAPHGPVTVEPRNVFGHVPDEVPYSPSSPPGSPARSTVTSPAAPEPKRVQYEEPPPAGFDMFPAVAVQTDYERVDALRGKITVTRKAQLMPASELEVRVRDPNGGVRDQFTYWYDMLRRLPTRDDKLACIIKNIDDLEPGTSLDGVYAALRRRS